MPLLVLLWLVEQTSFRAQVVRRLVLYLETTEAADVPTARQQYELADAAVTSARDTLTRQQKLTELDQAMLQTALSASPELQGTQEFAVRR